MSDVEQAVFVSYGWGGESEQMVDQIDQALQTRGIKIVRDKRDLGYKGSISEFMQRIGRGMCVIVVISDKYLRSPNCMYELVEIAKNKDFYDRVFPVVLGDADIYNPVNRLKYIKYWEEKLKELDEAMKTVSSAHLQGVREEIDSYDEIRDRISELTSTLKDMNTLTPDMHRQSDFNDMYAAIEKRLKERAGSFDGIGEIIEREYFEPETVLIPEGIVWLGSDPGEGVKEYDTPKHQVTLPAYRISKYPVLNREYAKFIQSETRVSAPLVGFSGLQPKTGLEDQPVKGVTLEDVRAYCKWLSELTNRQYDVPNEAQLEKAYQGSYGCSDVVDDIYLWTGTLWGENLSPPTFGYPYPKRDDGRNDPNANSQIRRVVYRYKKIDGTDRSKRESRSGQFPKQPLLPERYSFRVVMTIGKMQSPGREER